jgi:hypothetical protein
MPPCQRELGHVVIVASEEDSLRTNGFSHNHGKEEAEECYPHCRVDGFTCKVVE